jgi:hypothetical protein
VTVQLAADGLSVCSGVFYILLVPHRRCRPEGHETIDPAKAVIASEAKQSRGDGAHPRVEIASSPAAPRNDNFCRGGVFLEIQTETYRPLQRLASPGYYARNPRLERLIMTRYMFLALERHRVVAPIPARPLAASMPAL